MNVYDDTWEYTKIGKAKITTTLDGGIKAVLVFEDGSGEPYTVEFNAKESEAIRSIVALEREKKDAK